MKLGNLFIGKHEEIMRPVYPVDEKLMARIAAAKQRLTERNIEPVALLRVKTNPVTPRRSSLGRTFSPRWQSPAA